MDLQTAHRSASHVSQARQRIFLYRNDENLGLTKSLNILINKSQGEYIARHDSDDISLPNRFDEQLNYLNKYKVDGVTSRSLIKKNKRIIPDLNFIFQKVNS